MQAAVVPAGGSQLSSGAERSRNGRSIATFCLRRVVAAEAMPTRFEKLMGCRPDFGITADKQPHTGPGSKNGDAHCWWWLRYATLSLLFRSLADTRRDLLRHQAIDIEQVVLQAIIVRKFIRKGEALDRRGNSTQAGQPGHL